MKNRFKFFIPIFIIVFTLTTLVIVFSSWILTTSVELDSEEVEILDDPTLDEYNLINLFTYDSTEKYPHINVAKELNFESKYSVTYYNRSSSGELTAADNIINAGRYVARYYNIESRIYSDFSFTIEQAIPTLTCSYDSSEKIMYTPTFEVEKSKFVCTGLGNDGILDGDLSHVKMFPTEGTTNIDGLQLELVYSYVPFNKNYTTATITITIPLLAVARIGSAYYSRIETALNKADSGNEINIVFYDEISCNPIIYENCSIKNGVTLHINFGATSTNSSTAVHSGSTAGTYTVTNEVKMFPGVCLTINSGGKLEIGGELSGGGADYKCGATTGNSSVLTMGEGSGILSSGIIDVYGFIKEENKDNDSYVNCLNGEIYLPFIIRDFRGGSITYGMKDDLSTQHCAPFNQMQFENIESLLTVNYIAKLYGYANLYAGDQQNQTTICFISNTSSSLIQLNNPTYSYLESKYDKDTECCYINIYGGAQTNAMTMTINLQIPVLGSVSGDVSTEDVYFSLTFRQNITLNVNKNKNQNTANYTINQRYKLMPGASLTVNEGAILTASSIVVYKESDYTIKGAVGSSPYPSGKGDAKFIVNGEATINSEFGGLVQSTNEGAYLFINGKNTNTVIEPSGSEGQSIFTTVSYNSTTVNALVNIYQENNVPLKSTATQGVYQSSSYTYEGKTYYYWNQYSLDEVNSFTIKYVTNSDETILSNKTVYSLKTTLTLDETMLPDSSSMMKTGYSFENWYLDPDFTTIADGSSTQSTIITVYGDWELQTYNISYKGGATIEGENVSLDISNLVDEFPTSYTINTDSTIFDLQSISIDGYTFVEWCYQSNNGLIPIDQFNVLYATDVIFVARFNKVEKPYQVKYVLVYNGETVGTPEILISDLDIQGLFDLKVNELEIIKQNVINKYNNSDNLNHLYFLGYLTTDCTGWYINRACSIALINASEQQIKDVVDISGNDYQVLTIYGKLENKITVTYQDSNTSYYYIPNSKITLTENPNDTTDGYYITVWENNNRTSYGIYNKIEATLGSENVHFLKIKYIKTTFELSNANVKLSTPSGIFIYNPSTNSFTNNINGVDCYIKQGITVKVDDVTYTKTDGQSFNISNTSVKAEGETFIVADNNSPYIVTASSRDPVCFSSDTIIKTNNGDKYIYELNKYDLILSYNHVKGEYEYSTIAALIYHGQNIYQIMKLTFEDGTTIEFIHNHGLFDLTLNKYVDFTIENYSNYINHYFIKYDEGNNIPIKLVDVEILMKETGSYTLVSQENLNCVGNNLLNITSVLYGIYNIFDYTETHQYDLEKMNSDIEKYGVYTYSDFSQLTSYKIFIDYGFKYFKVSIGKGYMSYETVLYYIDWLHECIKNGTAIIY